MCTLFGNSELSLRIPNILCFLVYGFFCYKIVVENTKSTFATIIAASFLLFNHFLLEYFGLMRGYAMATAFLTGNIYYFLQALKKGENKYFPKAVLFSILTISVSYTHLTLPTTPYV